MFYGTNYTQEIERWAKGLHRILERNLIVMMENAQVEYCKCHPCPCSQVAGGRWQPGCGQLLHQCRTVQQTAPAAVLLLPTLNLLQNLQI